MYEQFLPKTKRELEQMKHDCKESINELEKSIRKTQRKIEDLKDDNEAKLLRRKNVKRTITIINLESYLLWVPGILAVIAAIVLIIMEHLVWGILLAVAGVALFVLGCIVKQRTKKYADEVKAANRDLAEFDQEHGKCRAEINSMESQIKDTKALIKDIDEFLKYEKYYRWVDAVRIGHVIAFATGDARPKDDKPSEPKPGKQYKSEPLERMDLNLNGNMCCRADKKSFSRQTGALAVLALSEAGALQVEPSIHYTVEPDHFTQTTEALPVYKDGNSKYIWYHVSSSMGGTRIFTQSFDSFEEFREAVKLSREDIMKLL